ncbi:MULTISPECIES: DUF2165 family protein [unclassified Variovorax]|uniref:DUF2165 family protein n=1 Tax=unclassified Variovorax TaxID=663243 RepID=UPI0025789C42|nr:MULTISPECIES: DUF2165 family protein [unclassified Variovorax]MDM0089487.1 DUF2165 family protein [Variovorax sp. J22G40]MDM0147559.1 DUF2165 family protein [Variovorax sp. J2P1-31]
MSLDATALFAATQALGLALWASLAVINNVQDFRGAAAAVGRTLSMAPLAEAPAIDTPLRRRAIRSPVLHRLGLVGVVLLQCIAAAALWTGCVLWAAQGTRVPALPWFDLGLAALSAAVLAMLLGGLATAYWIRQEALQQTHFLLLLWILAAFGVLHFGGAA